MPEEDAFCILVQLMNRYELRGHFTPQMDLLRQRLFQFDGLLEDHLPHVHRHFNEQGVKSNMYVSQWFLTLFAYKFPLDVVYRIYDILFIEGFHCLFRIGLALLSKNQSTILSLEFDSLVTFLKDDMLAIYNVSLCTTANHFWGFFFNRDQLYFFYFRMTLPIYYLNHIVLISLADVWKDSPKSIKMRLPKLTLKPK
jgi:hypothetical protein